MRQEIRTDRLCGGASMQAGSLRVSLLKPGGYCRAFCILRMRYCVRFDICAKALNFVAAMQRVILSTRTQRKIKKPCKNFRVSLFTKYLKYLFFKQCRIRNILNYYAFIDYFIGYHPLFFKYGTPITAFTPFFESA